LSDDRLPTELWVQIHLRRCSANAVPAALVRRGEPERGAVLLKLGRLGAAANDWERYLHRHPQGQEAEALRRQLRGLRQRLAALN